MNNFDSNALSKYNYHGLPLQGSGVYDDFLTDDTDGELLSSLLSR